MFAKEHVDCASKVSILYATLSAAWMLLAHGIILNLAAGEKQLGCLSAISGLLFIGVTSVILFVAVCKLASDIASMRRELDQRKSQEDEVRSSNEMVRAILETAVDGIITIDERGHILSANRAAERLFGYSSDELIGRNIAMLMPEPYRSAHDGYLYNYRNTGEHRIIGVGREVSGRRRDGSAFPMELAVGEARIGGARIFTGIVRDATERKRAEEALRQAKERAERADLAKSKFLAAASHDLRQPVQALMLFASTLEDTVEGLAGTPGWRFMKSAQESLRTLLDSLLDISRLDAGMVAPKLTSFPVDALLSRLAGEFGPAVADKRLSLRRATCSAEIRSDPVLLGRIVQNLLANAVRYTRQGKILLGCRRTAQGVRIEIWDSGIGIPADQLDDIFQEFHQVGNFERDRSQGLGLGLAIVQRLAHLLGITVRVRSWYEHGSVFSVEVPLASVDRQG